MTGIYIISFDYLLRKIVDIEVLISTFFRYERTLYISKGKVSARLDLFLIDYSSIGARLIFLSGCLNDWHSVYFSIVFV